MTDTQTEARAIVEAVARAWASIDGHADEFDREKDGGLEYEDPAFTGHYEGYMAEAQELLNRSGLATALAAKDAELAEANARAERQWAGWVKEEALRKAAEARLAEAMKALDLHVAYEARPADRGGKGGPKGQAWAAFIEARDKARRVYAGGKDA